MLVSAEIRLFWFDHKPAALEAWFHSRSIHGATAGRAEQRTDIYLCDPDQGELGVKTRGEKPGVEVKGLIAPPGEKIELCGYEIPIELWSKWPSQALSFPSEAGIRLHKRRWTRQFNTSAAEPVELPSIDAQLQKGCSVEWTAVDLASGRRCWTLGFEAFGGLPEVVTSLQSVVHMMSKRNPPPAPDGRPLSYPALIQELASATGGQR